MSHIDDTMEYCWGCVGSDKHLKKVLLRSKFRGHHPDCARTVKEAPQHFVFSYLMSRQSLLLSPV